MSSFDERRNNRIQKLDALKKAGMQAYPVVSRRDYSLVEVVYQFAKLSKAGEPLFLCGRVMSLRPQGALTFFTFDDGTAKFQGLIKKEEVSDAQFALFAEAVDIGDFIQV